MVAIPSTFAACREGRGRRRPLNQRLDLAEARAQYACWASRDRRCASGRAPWFGLLVSGTCVVRWRVCL